MNYSEVKRELKNEFESFLKPKGFASKCENQGCRFILNKNDIQFRFGYGVSNYINEFYVGLFGSLGRFDIQRVENLIFLENSFYNTLLLNKSDYFKDQNYRYHIKSLENIKEWIIISQTFYDEFAVPFFEKFITIDSIDKLLNNHPGEKVVYCDDLSWRIIKGLIAAKLNNNPTYDKLRDYYKNEVESKLQGYFMYEKCMKTINFLDQYTSEELNQLANESK